MRFLATWILAIVVASIVVIVGCGSGYTPPQSSITPDGAKPQAPPKTLSGSSSIHVSPNGLHLIEGFEGWSSCPYWDPFGRVWTRGYGETEGIHSGSPCISRAQGQERLASLVESRYQWAVRGLGVALNQNQVDALDSFVWNLGAGIFTGSLRFDLQRRQFFAASRIMLQYDHAGGVVLPGLARRRQVEVALFLKAAPTPSKPKPTHAHLERELAELRRDLRRHHCWSPPKYGGGKYHRICAHWRASDVRIHRALR